MTLSEELTWRGFVNQTTLEDVKQLDTRPMTFYFGVDPSAPSMQVGNLAAAMMARVFIKHGYKPVLLVGGATGLIGDPDGKAQERDLKSAEEVNKNKAGISAQYKQIFGGLDFTVVDNYDWFKHIGYLDFLRDIGKHVPMRQMLARDFVQSRLGENGAGISYAEFSYSLIQGYDFLHLHEKYNVTLQISGADQWGNSIAGVDLIRRKTGNEAHVWTAPLVINKTTGIKFGKTEGGAIWLDPTLTSPYKFYQFWLNIDDDNTEDYLKIFTTLEKSVIDAVISEFSQKRSSRIAQKKLAYEVTALVHGRDVADSIVTVTDVLFGGKDYRQLTQNQLLMIKNELPFVAAEPGESLQALLISLGLASSSSEARRFIEQGGVYVNGNQVKSNHSITQSDTIDGHHLIVRRGKNNNGIVQIN